MVIAAVPIRNGLRLFIKSRRNEYRVAVWYQQKEIAAQGAKQATAPPGLASCYETLFSLTGSCINRIEPHHMLMPKHENTEKEARGCEACVAL